MTRLCRNNESSHNIVEFGYWIDAKRKIFSRNKYATLDQINAFISQRNNYGIYQTAFRYDHQDLSQATLYGDLYLDFDSEDDFELARQDAMTTLAFFKVVFRLHEEDVKIYFSGKKGLHLIVPKEILGIEPHKHLNLIFKTIAQHLSSFIKNNTLDLVIYDPRRLFRIPNSQHEKTNLHKIQLAPYELKQLAYDEILALAVKPRAQFGKRPRINNFANAQYKTYIDRMERELKSPKRSLRHETTLKCTPPCVEHILEHGSHKGMRNNTVAALASFYKARGYELEQALDEVVEWNATKNRPPVSKGELTKTVNSIYHGSSLYGCTKLKDVSICDENKCPLKAKGS